jgi:hypothetical protein
MMRQRGTGEPPLQRAGAHFRFILYGGIAAAGYSTLIQPHPCSDPNLVSDSDALFRRSRRNEKRLVSLLNRA